MFVTFLNLFLKIHDLDRVAAMDELWNRALESLKERLGKQHFETWIKPASFVSLTKTELRLKVPNKFFRDWLTEHFLGQIEEAVSTIAQQKISVTFDVGPWRRDTIRGPWGPIHDVSGSPPWSTPSSAGSTTSRSA